jgi:hypothetical protein
MEIRYEAIASCKPQRTSIDKRESSLSAGNIFTAWWNEWPLYFFIQEHVAVEPRL